MNTDKNNHPSEEYGFSKMKFLCPKCGWIGFGKDTVDIGMSEFTLFDAGCPKCNSMRSLGAVFYDCDSRSCKFFPYENIIE